MIKDYFLISWNSLRTRKLRSWLTLLGIFIGIAAVVSLIGLGQGLQKSINDQFSLLGTDKIFIQPKGAVVAPGGSLSSNLLTKDDVAVVKTVRGVDEVTSFIVANAKIEFGDEVRFFQIYSIPLDETHDLFSEINTLELNKGRDLRKGDKFSAVVGAAFEEDFIFEKSVRVRDKLKINDQEFKIVGSWKRIGSPPDDRSIGIPEDVLRDLFDIKDRVDFVVVRIDSSEKPSDVKGRLNDALSDFRNVEEDNEDFDVQTSDQLLESFNAVLSIVQVVLVGIAAISLLVGGIGIMNTMFTATLERTKEIGIMKAVGAKNRDVFLLFLIESGLLGLSGGIIGIVLGVSFSKIVEFVAVNLLKITFLTVFFPWWSIVGALLFSFFVGAISGTWPAINASYQQPVQALRYE